MQTRSLKPEFLEALLGEDDLGVVVRTHIHIESSVNALLEILIPFPDELPRLRYEQKLKLCCAMGMDKDLFAPLKDLGDLRNSFGHNINTKLSSVAIEKFLGHFSSEDRESIARTYFKTRSEVDQSLPESFKELEPKSQLVGIALLLNAMLDVLQEDARKRTPNPSFKRTPDGAA